MAKKSLLDSVEIKTPCDQIWDKMRGNDEVRFCSHCAKDVHNLSAMTRLEARKLVARSNGNLCVRYVEGADGKMQTPEQRPLYRIGKRTAHVAAGVFGAALSLSAPTYAQGGISYDAPATKQEKSAARKSAEVKTDAATASISGTVFDIQGAVIPAARIVLTNAKSGKTYTTKSNDEGFYDFPNLAPSIYRIEAEFPGFVKLTVTEIDIKEAQKFERNLNMEVEATTELVGDIIIIAVYKVQLMDAVSIGDKVQVRELVALGRDVNEKDKSYRNQSALHVAAETGDAEIAQMLVEANADVNIADDDGETPLMIAAQHNHLQVVRLLLKAGANLHLQDNGGKTALQKTTAEEIKRLFAQYGARE